MLMSAIIHKGNLKIKYQNFFIGGGYCGNNVLYTGVS
jgi:hypothetical protein